MAETATDIADKKLYIKFPQKVPSAEEVKGLSPYIVRVSFPRQKSARFCHIVLESKSVVPEVLKQLNKKEYKNGRLRVEMPRKLQYIKNGQESRVPEKKIDKENKTGKVNNKLAIRDGSSMVPQTEANESKPITPGTYVRRQKGKPATGGDNDRRLWITKLPFKTEDKELVASFPGCIWAKVYRSKASKSSRAVCKFSTAQQATTFLADPSKHQFRGKEVVVTLAKSQQLRGSGMKKKNGLKNENSVMDNEVESKVESETAVESESSGEECMDIKEDDDDDSENGDDTGDVDVNSSEDDD